MRSCALFCYTPVLLLYCAQVSKGHWMEVPGALYTKMGTPTRFVTLLCDDSRWGRVHKELAWGCGWGVAQHCLERACA